MPTARREGADPHGQPAGGRQRPATPARREAGRGRQSRGCRSGKAANSRNKRGKREKEKKSKFTHLRRLIPAVLTDSRSYAAAVMSRCSAGRLPPLERPGRAAGGSPPPPAPLRSPGGAHGPASSSRWPGAARSVPPAPPRGRPAAGRGRFPPHGPPSHTRWRGGAMCVVFRVGDPPQSAARAPSQGRERVVFAPVYFNLISYR